MAGIQNIWVNGRALLRRTTGVERYTAEITRHFVGGVRMISPPESFQGVLGHLWEQFILPLRIPRAAVLWSPANSGPLGVERQVVTIHDLSSLEHPEWFQPGFAHLYRTLLPRLVMRAKAIIVPSGYVKTRLLDSFSLSADKITVVPEGVDQEHFFPRQREETEQVRQRYCLPEKYLLAVGTMQPRKNLDNLLAAWELVHPQQPGLELVLVGGPGSQFKRMSLETTVSGVRFLGYVHDAELPAIYSSALGYVSASLDEGFGLTLLEAMACGTPVASARIGALPELLDGAGLLFDPTDPQEIATALETLATKPGLRSDLVRRGHERARCFSWRKSAQEVWELLQAVA